MRGRGIDTLRAEGKKMGRRKTARTRLDRIRYCRVEIERMALVLGPVGIVGFVDLVGPGKV